jgi:hypothetical protein
MSNVHDIRNTKAAVEAHAPREPDASIAIAAHLAKTRFEDHMMVCQATKSVGSSNMKLDRHKSSPGANQSRAT